MILGRHRLTHGNMSNNGSRIDTFWQCVDGIDTWAGVGRGPNATEAALATLAEDPDVAERLDRVGPLIEGFETPSCVELPATVHWVAQDEPGAALDAAAAIAKVHEWSARKRQ